MYSHAQTLAPYSYYFLLALIVVSFCLLLETVPMLQMRTKIKIKQGALEHYSANFSLTLMLPSVAELKISVCEKLFAVIPWHANRHNMGNSCEHIRFCP